MIWSRRLKVTAAVRTPTVVMRHVLGQHRLQVTFPKISIRSVTSARTVRTNRSAYAFARGQRGGIFTAVIPTSRTHRNLR
jgi:hypothetical protein